MTIYIDTAFLINFTFDAQLITLTCLICSKKVKPYRVLFTAIMGGVQGVLVFFPYFDILSLPPVNILVSLMMSTIAVCPCKTKDFLKFYMIFLSLSFCLAGIMTFLSLRGIIGAFLIFPAYAIIRKIKSEIVLKRTKVSLYLDGKKIEKDALYDSGNSVFYFGKPVIFGNSSLIYELFDKEFCLYEYSGICIIPYKTVGKSGIVMGIRLDRAVIDGKSYDGTVLGLFDEKLKDEIILNGVMM